MSADVPTGIRWGATENGVTGHVLQLVDGQHRQVATVHYTHEQAAKVAMQLLDAIGGKQ